MLRPERMSRVSVTGSKRVMDDVIEAVHDLQLFDMTDYDGGWEGFQPGDPIEGAEAASEKLVTVRSLESILEVDEEVAGPARGIDDEELEQELETARERANDLDDRRDDIEDELRAVEEQLDAVEPFVTLGLDLDLLQGYENLQVAVGEGDEETVRRELVDAEGVDAFDIFGEDDVLAVFAYPADAPLADVLVSASFTGIEIPDADEDPASYVSELEQRKKQLESKLTTVENELEELKLDVGGFLLAAEEKLSIEVQKREAPLSFATTRNAFVAEGWVPTEQFVDLAEALQNAAGDHIEVEELEQRDYEVHDDHSASPAGEPVAADGGSDIAMSNGTPPVVQDNPGVVKPFEALLEVINRPKYDELDPTLIMFLTFPVFFGFMIGDLGYGLMYMGIGYLMMQRFESDMIRSLGGIGLLSGLFTAIFGILYGEFFGLHQLGYILWDGLLPFSQPMHKGLQPHYIYYAQAWLLLSVTAGVAHMTIGRVFDFINKLHHGVVEAFVESLSWTMMTVGTWLWVFSTIASNAKPPFMFSVFASGEGTAIPLGFTGFDPVIGWAGAGIALVGLVLAVYAEGGIALVESITEAFGHVISYTRIAAVLLAKAGMALAVNLLVFGAYAHHGEFHLLFFASPSEVAEAQANGWVIFSGLLNGEGAAALILGGLAGLLVLVLGHLLVLILGVTSAGLQAVRLEYVEFFGKFYEGGGRKYTPFGYERKYTADE